MKMKAIGIGLAAALTLAGATTAEERPDSGRWISPKYDQVKAKWPHEANGSLVYGKVLLDCAAGPDGAAADCKVEASSPSDMALEKAALAVAPLFKARDRRIPRAALLVDVQFDEEPAWLHKPQLDEMMAVFPTAARGRAGDAVVQCIVKTDGLVRSCTVASETPAGAGFGGAALLLAPTFLMKPAIKQGQAVEAEITIPVHFQETGGTLNGPSVKVFSTAVWTKTPTMPEILAELDKKVGDKFAEGKVVFQCEVSVKTGHLSNCTTINSSPGMVGFIGAARTLTSKFQADPQFLAGIKNETRVNLAFSFPDMQSDAWSKRQLARPIWIRTISPDPDKATFPEAAAKAGLKTGLATVDCVLGATGALTQCKTVSESTPGLGFGEMAQAIAEVFVANPWTDDGLPADGAHVLLPIRMNYDPPASPPADAPPTPSTKP